MRRLPVEGRRSQRPSLWLSTTLPFLRLVKAVKGSDFLHSQETQFRHLGFPQHRGFPSVPQFPTLYVLIISQCLTSHGIGISCSPAGTRCAGSLTQGTELKSGLGCNKRNARLCPLTCQVSQQHEHLVSRGEHAACFTLLPIRAHTTGVPSARRSAGK